MAHRYKAWSFRIALIILIGGTWASGCTADVTARPSAGSARLFDRVFIIVLENTHYYQARGAPFLGHLAKTGALLTNFHAVGHPSYPNYVAMVSGSTHDLRTNDQRDIDGKSIVDLLEARHVTWKVYAEDLPAPCFQGAESTDGLYVRRHVPLVSFRNVQTNSARCTRIVEAGQLAADVAADALAQFSLYIPNVKHNGHNTSLLYADTWLQTFLAPLLRNAHFVRNALVVVTFDEGVDHIGNRVYTILLGPMVASGTINSARYSHYSLLRLIEANFGLGTLGHEDAKARPICCVWKP